MYLINKHKNITNQLIVGFVTGSLFIIWPWNKVSTENIEGYYKISNLENSNNYLKTQKIILSHEKPKLVLIPPYYANAHLCLSQTCVFHYKWSYAGKYTDAKKQSSYKWNDPKISIKWPIKKPILSLRDKKSKYSIRLN